MSRSMICKRVPGAGKIAYCRSCLCRDRDMLRTGLNGASVATSFQRIWSPLGAFCTNPPPLPLRFLICSFDAISFRFKNRAGGGYNCPTPVQHLKRMVHILRPSRAVLPFLRSRESCRSPMHGMRVGRRVPKSSHGRSTSCGHLSLLSPTPLPI
jgi:hypothetical protein